MNDVLVRPLKKREGEYSLVLAAMGFESRSSHLARRVEGARRHAIGFTDRQVLAFEENNRIFKELDYTIDVLPDSDIGLWAQGLFQELIADREPDEPVSVAVDVSSMSRPRIAAIVEACLRTGGSRPVEVDFLYSLAEFSPPPNDFGPNIHVGPVVPFFAGWTTEPDQPPALVLGLGYEQDRALGAVEHLQPGVVWAFEPKSSIAEYAPRVHEANAILLGSLPQERVISYSVERPFDCFTLLESLVHGLGRESMPVLIPLGPKIFAVIALLAAAVHLPKVAVWRVSGGEGEDPVDRRPSGIITGISAHFGANDH